jgi:hypothetical protein
MTNTIETSRAEALRKAQERADDLFQCVETNALIRAGITESQLNEEIYKLAETEFGVTKHWHKRIVRAGPNTLAPADSTNNCSPSISKLREFDERSIEETARMMGISVENVKSRVFRGRRKLCWLLDRPKARPDVRI